jgi:hypothetical protein
MPVFISICFDITKAKKQIRRWSFIGSSLKWNIGRVSKSDFATLKAYEKHNE